MNAALTSLLLVVAAATTVSAAMIGGKQPLTPEDVESEEFRGALDAATLEANRLSSHPRFHAMFNFQQGTKQLVAGVLYEFSAVLRVTACENHEAQNADNLGKCRPVDLLGASEFHCTFKILHQPWNTQAQYQVLSQPRCISPRDAVPFAGQKIPLTPEEASSTMFLGAMTASAVNFNQHSQLSKLHSLVRFDHATKQVVAGMLFEFDGLFVETVCDNVAENHGKGIEECAVGNSARTFTCHFRVLFQAWMQTKYTVLNEPDCRERI